MLSGILQGDTPAIVEQLMWLGLPDGVAPNADSASSANCAARARILSRVCAMASCAAKVAVSRAERCPWLLFARVMYLRHAPSKVMYSLPFVLGVNFAGARLVTVHAKWALTAVTGQTTWPHTTNVFRSTRCLCAGIWAGLVCGFLHAWKQ